MFGTQNEHLHHHYSHKNIIDMLWRSWKLLNVIDRRLQDFTKFILYNNNALKILTNNLIETKKFHLDTYANFSL